MKRKLNKKHCADFILSVICILFFAYLLASFIDTNLHNHPFTDSYGNYADWNIFNIIFKECV
jgi:hypothetical protein